MKTCYFCKGPLCVRRIEHMHEWGGERFLIRNVRGEVCTQCGETFLAPATLKQIDRLVTKGRPKEHVSVAVFDLKSRAA
ncbi:MAG TPA: YgiT-type zinc finger protein [Candidatus Binatia bacterium]|jgi:YgiT-type zinc finger domain-containing protein